MLIMQFLFHLVAKMFYFHLVAQSGVYFHSFYLNKDPLTSYQKALCSVTLKKVDTCSRELVKVKQMRIKQYMVRFINLLCFTNIQPIINIIC